MGPLLVSVVRTHGPRARARSVCARALARRAACVHFSVRTAGRVGGASVLVQPRRAAVCVPRVSVTGLNDDVRVLLDEHLALLRLEGEDLPRARAELPDSVIVSHEQAEVVRLLRVVGE